MSVAEYPQDAPEPESFVQRMLDLLERIEYRPVVLSEDLEAVYRLRYEAYRREGFMPPNPERLCYDELDDTPNAYWFGVYLDGKLASSLRIHVATAEQPYSAGMLVFSDILQPLLDQGKVLIDPSRFTTDYEMSLQYPALSYLTLRIALMASQYFEADYALHVVRPEHGPYYRRVFYSEPMAEARDYPGLTFPVQLYATETPITVPKIIRRHPFFRSTRAERRLMFDRDELGTAPLTVLPTARFAIEALEGDAVPA